MFPFSNFQTAKSRHVNFDGVDEIKFNIYKNQNMLIDLIDVASKKN